MANDYVSERRPVWCPGCGNYAIGAALAKALADLQADRSRVLIVSGIGCGSEMPHSFSTYGIDSLHGRLLPIAEGAKLANGELTVVASGGDGDCYGIGAGHLIHAARRNINITLIVSNNELYGLTTGQASPTTKMGTKTKSTPFGDIERPLNPLALAISAGATYVARAFAGDPQQMSELMLNGIGHRGFSIIDVLSPCVTFTGQQAYDLLRKKVYKVGQDHDRSNVASAMQKALECDLTGWEKVPTGLIYETEVPTYEDLDVALKKGPLISQPLPGREDVSAVMDELR